MLTKLLARFPAYTIAAVPTPDFVAQYRDVVPPELIEVWEQYGFGTFCDGYLKIVNPTDYTDLLVDTYARTSSPNPTQIPPLVLFATSMGDLLVWERGYLVLVDFRHSNTNVAGKNFKVLFRNLADEGYLKHTLQWEPYPDARARLGEPAFDECFGYVPLLALGGPELVENLEKVKLREHIALISQFAGLLER